MKKVYQAPALEIETYDLDAHIASNCNVVVDMGPDGPGAEKVCESYYVESGETMPTNGISAFSYNVDFWAESNCGCYYSASGAFFTS